MTRMRAAVITEACFKITPNGTTWPADYSSFHVLLVPRSGRHFPGGRLLETGGGMAMAARFGQRARPFVGLLFGLRFGHAIPHLDAPHQLILLAGDGLPVVIGEFPPALAAGAEELLPLAFDLVPIHVVSFTDDPLSNEFVLARLPPFEFASLLSDIPTLRRIKLHPHRIFCTPPNGPPRAHGLTMSSSHRERH